MRIGRNEVPMPIRLLWSVLIVFALAAPGINAQGAFLENGRSGGGTAISISVNDGNFGVSTSIIATFSSRADLGILAGRVSGEGVSYFTGGLSARVYPLRQDAGPLPFSLSLAGIAERSLSDGVTSKSYAIGSSIFTNLSLSSDDDRFYQPFISVLWGRTSVTHGFYHNEQLHEYSLGETQLSTGIGFSYVRESASRRIWSITPCIVFAENVTTFTFTVGYLIPSRAKR